MVLGGVLELIVVAVQNTWLVGPECFDGTSCDWLLRAFQAIQFIGASLAERLYPFIGYAAAITTGLAAQTFLFGVLTLGLMTLRRAVQNSE